MRFFWFAHWLYTQIGKLWLWLIFPIFLTFCSMKDMEIYFRLRKKPVISRWFRFLFASVKEKHSRLKKYIRSRGLYSWAETSCLSHRDDPESWAIPKTNWSQTQIITHRVHICYIYLQEWLKSRIHVGKYAIHGPYGWFFPCISLRFTQWFLGYWYVGLPWNYLFQWLTLRNGLPPKLKYMILKMASSSPVTFAVKMPKNLWKIHHHIDLAK